MRIVRSYDWNGHRYVIVEQDDGSMEEMKDMTDNEAMAQMPAPAVGVSPATPFSLTDVSDADLVQAVIDRGIQDDDMVVAVSDYGVAQAAVDRGLETDGAADDLMSRVSLPIRKAL
jgi:hypothetical protein